MKLIQTTLAQNYQTFASSALLTMFQRHYLRLTKVNQILGAGQTEKDILNILCKLQNLFKAIGQSGMGDQIITRFIEPKIVN